MKVNIWFRVDDKECLNYHAPISALDLHVGDITGCLCTPQKARVGMYSGCDYPYKSLFVYLLALAFLFHPSIIFNCFYLF